jgi:hypothetical protein
MPRIVFILDPDEPEPTLSNLESRYPDVVLRANHDGAPTVLLNRYGTLHLDSVISMISSQHPRFESRAHCEACGREGGKDTVFVLRDGELACAKCGGSVLYHDPAP